MTDTEKALNIAKILCVESGLELSYMVAKTRKREVLQVRQSCHYLIKKFTKLSLGSIGKLIGNLNYATVLHSCNTINNLLLTDKIFRSDLEHWENIVIDFIRYNKLKEAYNTEIKAYKVSKALFRNKSACKRHGIDFKIQVI